MGFLGVIFRQTIILFFVSDKSSTPAEPHFSRIMLVVILKNHYFCRPGDKQYSLKDRTVGSMNKLLYCFLLTTLLCGCKERKELQAPVRQPCHDRICGERQPACQIFEPAECWFRIDCHADGRGQ